MINQKICASGVLGFVVAVMAGSASAADASSATMPGYGAADATAQHQLEQAFDAGLNAEDLRGWMKQMAAEPNQVGSAHDKANAEFMLQQFKNWGWDAHIETFQVLYPTPKSTSLELIAPTHFTAALHEPPVAGDASSANTANALPPYNVYGADGDVSAPLVYVNYGMPDDYKALARRGIDVKGKIVITRYGGGWRGLKPKLAQEHGAVGCLIYSDPANDGYGAGDIYPKGGFRPPEGVQRGSVEDMTLYSGDPLTPGVGATAKAKRLKIADAKVILKIPVMPISYADAQPLLAALGGPVAPQGWRGGLPLTYHIGGDGDAKAHMKIASDWSLKPIYDVIAMIKGSEYPDEWVLRGNHHDGWVFGAWDPLAGNVALMAEAKSIGALLKRGWRPKRTLVYASWDGEEPGLLGSSEWAEEHADELRRKAVVYVNSDTNGRGFMFAGGSHDLQALVNQVASGVKDPETGVSVLERMRAKILVDGFAKNASEQARMLAKQVKGDKDVPLEALGSGSDFTPFLQHLGVASLDLGFGGEDDDGGIYHSVYDSYEHYARFGDPSFAYGVALAKVAGHVMLRVADADVVPMHFTEFADTIGRYVTELHELADHKREHSVALDELLKNGDFKLAADPTKTLLPPLAEDTVPYLDLAPLDNAVVALKASAKAYDDAAVKAALPAPQARKQLNALLLGMEQTLIAKQGLPGRPWYQHMIYAPGMYTGYGVKTLPGVREAIEEAQWDDAQRYAVVDADVLKAYAHQLDQATALLK
ncbi:transferrin receptor-like dimerization domain-containing protein [Solimonas marina]|uniref:M28 family peptidase n=1 Tax=Solimonas marina TaxID=2714601 RepID=A0A969W9H2_9GAMM|nr:transferrin receptor-like dimerization domain-containing protein [Solimonas marina]NKF23117.1 M28 family peptidase [Solimonas marina]